MSWSRTRGGLLAAKGTRANISFSGGSGYFSRPRHSTRTLERAGRRIAPCGSHSHSRKIWGTFVTLISQGYRRSLL